MPRLLTNDEVRLIGETLGGKTHWQSDLARAIDCSKSQITRYLNRSRPTNPLLARDLKALLVSKIERLTSLVSCEALPGATSPNTRRAQALVAEAISLLQADDD